MSNVENKAYVAALKTKKATANGQIIVCVDKEKEQYEFKSLRDVVFNNGVSLYQYLVERNAAAEQKIAALERRIAELAQKVNGADVL